MSNKIIIPFDGAKVADIESGGLTTFIGFDRLRNVLSNYAGTPLSDDEKIIGFVIDKEGISIRISNR
jgi:hypothetical protein